MLGENEYKRIDSLQAKNKNALARIEKGRGKLKRLAASTELVR